MKEITKALTPQKMDMTNELALELADQLIIKFNGELAKSPLGLLYYILGIENKFNIPRNVLELVQDAYRAVGWDSNAKTERVYDGSYLIVLELKII